MRLTCLKCGNQMEVGIGGPAVALVCTCGTEISCPEVLNTGVLPNERAAERSRYKAFRAAGVVKNMGAFALGLSLLGLVFFPLGLVGASVGIYVLTMMRGPLGRYSGRRSAVAAIAVGVGAFVGEGALALRWLEAKRLEKIAAMQTAAADDLRALLRTQRLYRAAQDRYGTFKEFRFQPRHGAYTIYLAPDDWVAAKRGEETFTDPLPPEWVPGVSDDAFTAIAVANLDSDADLDVWLLTERGEVRHVRDDAQGAE